MKEIYFVTQFQQPSVFLSTLPLSLPYEKSDMNCYSIPWWLEG